MIESFTLACEDNSASLCMGKEGDCDRKDFAGEWMRLNCKRTCRMCGKRFILHLLKCILTVSNSLSLKENDLR